MNDIHFKAVESLLDIAKYVVAVPTLQHIRQHGWLPVLVPNQCQWPFQSLRCGYFIIKSNEPTYGFYVFWGGWSALLWCYSPECNIHLEATERPTTTPCGWTSRTMPCMFLCMCEYRDIFMVRRMTVLKSPHGVAHYAATQIRKCAIVQPPTNRVGPKSNSINVWPWTCAPVYTQIEDWWSDWSAWTCCTIIIHTMTLLLPAQAGILWVFLCCVLHAFHVFADWVL